MKADLDRSLGDAERVGSLADVHFFDVPEQHDVTVNLRQSVNGLAQNGRELLLLQSLAWDLAPTGQNSRSKVASLLLGEGVERVLAAGSGLAKAAQALVASDGERPGAELRLTAKQMQVAVDLNDGFLRRIFGVGLVAQDRHQEKEDRPLTGADQIVEKLLFSRKNAADTVGLELGIGCVLHRSSGAGVEIGPAALRRQKCHWRELYRDRPRGLSGSRPGALAVGIQGMCVLFCPVKKNPCRKNAVGAVQSLHKESYGRRHANYVQRLWAGIYLQLCRSAVFSGTRILNTQAL